MCSWIIISTSFADAQVIYDAYGMSTASADLISPNGIFISKNPASVVNINSTSFLTSQIIPFSIPNLSANTISIVGKWKSKGYALEYSQSGIKQYKVHYFSFSNAIKISKKIDLGLKLLSRTQVLIDADNYTNYGIEIGIVQHLSNRFNTGIHLKYRTSKSISAFEKSSVAVGLNYYIDPKLIGYVTMEMSETGEIYLRSAFDYSIKKFLSTRIGWSSTEGSFCGGIGYSIKQLKVEVSTSYHNNLGMSYGAALCYTIGKI